MLIGVRYPIQHVFRRKEGAKIGGAHLIAEADLIVELELSVEVLRELGAILNNSFWSTLIIKTGGSHMNPFFLYFYRLIKITCCFSISMVSGDI